MKELMPLSFLVAGLAIVAICAAKPELAESDAMIGAIGGTFAAAASLSMQH